MAFTTTTSSTAHLASAVGRAREQTSRTACALSKPAKPSRSACPPALALPKHRTCTSLTANPAARHGGLVFAAAATDGDIAVEPTVMIDNLSDPLSTIVVVEFGDYLGELLDTMAALKGLGLNISKASINVDGKESNAKRFFVTDSKTSDKVVQSARLEEIKTVIMNTMMEYHPEAIPKLSAGRKRAPWREDGKLGEREEPPIPTSIKIWRDETGSRSRLDVVTTDRNGLLVDIVRILKDISVNVISAEIDTIGAMAHDIFFLTYKGEALPEQMEELVKNALYYYLVLTEVETAESY